MDDQQVDQQDDGIVEEQFTIDEAMKELTRRFKERPDETTGDSPKFTQKTYFRELAESAGVDTSDNEYTGTEVNKIEQAERDNNAAIQNEIDESTRMTGQTPRHARISINSVCDQVARDFLSAHGGVDRYNVLPTDLRPRAFDAMAELGIKYYDELIPGVETAPGSEWTTQKAAERLRKFLLDRIEQDYAQGGS